MSKDASGQVRLESGDSALVAARTNAYRNRMAYWYPNRAAATSEERAFTWDEFNALGQEQAFNDIHCVTTWSLLDSTWQGVQLAALAALALAVSKIIIDDGAMNAAVLAVQIAGVADPEIQKRLWRFKDDLAEGLRL